MAKWTETNQLEYEGTDPGTGGKIVAFEVQASRAVGGEAAELAFLVEGTADETQARTVAEDALVAWDALSFDGKPLVGVALKPEYTDEDSGDPQNGFGFGRWHVQASYSRRAFTAPALLDDGQQLVPQAMEFDISGERRHITHSLHTRSQSVASGQTTIPFGGAIRVKKQGKNISVEGTDVVIPRMAFSIPKTVPTERLTPGVIMGLQNLVGKMNRTPFTLTFKGVKPDHSDDITLTYSRGELRFMGVSGRIVQGATRTDLVFRFESSPTETNVKIAQGTPNEITVPLVLGFDLLWVSYAETQTEETITVKPRQANVEVVCEEEEFACLSSVGLS